MSASPVGIRVPKGGSKCANCKYVARQDGHSVCKSDDYVKAEYEGKLFGMNVFVDGKTGDVIEDPEQFCCNFYDWDDPAARNPGIGKSLARMVRR